MDVQLPQSGASSKAWLTKGTTRSAVAITPVGSREPVRAVKGHKATGTALRIRLIGWHEQLNRQVTGSQRTLDFLDQSIGLLQQLKAEISGKLAGEPIAQARLDSTLAKFTAQWAERHAATNGYLDDRLAFTGDPSARQRFRIEGFDLQSLQSGHPETFTFYLGKLNRRSASVNVEPGMAADAIVRKLNYALGPMGVSAVLDAGGALIFSTLEADWPTVRNQLMILGDGGDSSGRPKPVKLELLPAKINPAQWNLTDQSPALRTTLQRVVDAQDQIKQARKTVQNVIDHMMEVIDKKALERRDQDQRAQAVPENFSIMLERSNDYQLFSMLAPVLSGISQYRVLSLL